MRCSSGRALAPCSFVALGSPCAPRSPLLGRGFRLPRHSSRRGGLCRRDSRLLGRGFRAPPPLVGAGCRVDRPLLFHLFCCGVVPCRIARLVFLRSVRCGHRSPAASLPLAPCGRVAALPPALATPASAAGWLCPLGGAGGVLGGLPLSGSCGGLSAAPSGTPPALNGLAALPAVGTAVVASLRVFRLSRCFASRVCRGFPSLAASRGLPPAAPRRVPAVCTHFLSRAGREGCPLPCSGLLPCAPRGGRAARPPAPRGAPTRRAVFFIVFCHCRNCNFAII